MSRVGGVRPAGAGSDRPSDGVTVTLDGPAGSGKSTTARAVARRLGYRHLDSGALYRALAYALLEAGIPTSAWPDLTEEDLRGLDVRLRPDETGFAVTVGGRPVDRELRTPEVTAETSRLATLPVVRRCLLDLQRGAGAHGGLVADGRDMGTVVFPHAEVKVYLDAGLEERARRRLLERHGRPPSEDELAREVQAIAERDRRDSTRAHSPLRKPDDAHVLDTTGLDFQAQVDAVVALVRRALGDS